MKPGCVETGVAHMHRAVKGLCALLSLGLVLSAPGFSSALAYYDSLASERLPASLVQGQRDFFGAHTYHRVDRPGTFHTMWSEDRREVKTADE